MSRDRILIVDDDIDVLESLHDELCASFDVEAVSSGAEAIARLRAGRYDAVVADLRMPEVNGIQVLEAARARDPEIVRIMLTGHLDDEARKATLGPDAPFKIGKPWHDALDVTLRRAFEHRARVRGLSASFGTLLDVAGVDDALAATEGPSELARAVVEQARRIDGIVSLRVAARDDDGERMLAGFGAEAPPAGEDDWTLQVPLRADGRVVAHARGSGEQARAIAEFVLDRASRWLSDAATSDLFASAIHDPAARAQLYALNRRATLGAMTTSITHELASLVQNVQLCLGDLEPAIAATGHADLQDSLHGAIESADRLVKLYRSLRSFVGNGEAPRRACRVADLVAAAVGLCSVQARRRRPIRIGPLPEAESHGDATLLVQAIVNLLRNAVEFAPERTTIDVDAVLDGPRVHVRVVDDGPGVAPELVPRLFQPFATSKSARAGCGLGLAVAAQIARDHGGHVRYSREPGRGACFSLVLPRAQPGTN